LSLVSRLDYGLDAPGICRGMFLAGGLGTLLLVSMLAVFGKHVIAITIAAVGVIVALYGFLMGGYMIWSSRVGKLKTREDLLNEVRRLRGWTGGETVLDVGCGRGLMLIGAARRLTTGMAIGVDIWRSEDQAQNSPEAALANARLEGVLDRVRIETGDARALPVEDASVDVVTSHWVVHNLASPEDRSKALREMWRVLKPGGIAVVADIAHVHEYGKQFAEFGAAQVRVDEGGWQAWFFGTLSGGSYRPQTVFATCSSVSS
jgi:SAM-dependent methyltransferase